MESPRFKRCMEQVWKNEGVVLSEDGKTFVKSGDYTADGTHTRAGIAFEFNQEALAEVGITRPEQMWEATPEQLAPIYFHKYWVPSRAEVFKNRNLAYQVFDSCVNQGRGCSTRILQETINTLMPSDIPLAVDGGFGPKTMENLMMCIGYQTEGIILSVYRVIRELYYYQRLFDESRERPDDQEAILDRFETSWMRRLKVVLL